MKWVYAVMALCWCIFFIWGIGSLVASSFAPGLAMVFIFLAPLAVMYNVSKAMKAP